MKIISAGGFFHDLNFTYFDSDSPTSIICVEEERFSRIKSHKISDPSVKTDFLSLKYIEASAQISLSDIDLIIISDLYEPACLKSLREMMHKAKVKKIGHHISHAFNVIATNDVCGEAAVLVLDGYGDNLSGVSGHYKDHNFRTINEFSADNSLGLLYSAATQHLGLGGFGSEGKLQGLASYGNYSEELSIKSEISITSGQIDLSDRLIEKDDFADQELYAVNALKNNPFYSNLIERRFYDEPLTQEHADFANTIQTDIFKTVYGLVESLTSINTETLILSGGIAQNSSLINYLYKNTSYQRVLTSTSCSDRGNSLGALVAYLESNNIFGSTLTPFLGLSNDSDCSISLSDSEIERVCNLLKKNKIIGVVEGRAELGARALGNRSIIACPCDVEMKEKLNNEIKHREKFRPFAPVVQTTLVDKYFDVKGKSDHKYMTKCFDAKNIAIDKYPSAVHVDNTSRLQILDASNGERLISKLSIAMSELHGIDLLINTSFNDNKMPIVNSIDDALSCAKRTNLDHVVFKDRVVEL